MFKAFGFKVNAWDETRAFTDPNNKVYHYNGYDFITQYCNTGLLYEIQNYARELGVSDFVTDEIINDYDKGNYIEAIDKVWELIELLPNKVGSCPSGNEVVACQVKEYVSKN